MNMELAMPQEESTMKRILKNQKGLTLIELLAVIVILGIIVAIAIPSIGNIIGRSEIKAQRANAHMLIDAARMSVTNLGFTPDVANGNTMTLDLNELVTNGYLNGVPKDPYINNATYAAATSHVTITRTIQNQNTNTETEIYNYGIFLESSAGVDYFGTTTNALAENTIDTISPPRS